ncbi:MULTISPECIES: DNA cytosine methyltransferase [unclassified Pseudodesulfovibrio]|uniref:DNA cytosine methyltransferase n=1 Tax=unclassified Pseudodesulfovibrio TaxID=2661612 RepID=UPI000FEBA6E6|nr:MULTISPECIES: DNA cytosine methyltransferase [unclassified Pseudodesulfovibrio]MCJ2165592.1 DNA cytosine methyltransferase [Pseudodesulfovibrio sp. S3-i]RWU03000.1 DNA cytosine methyltransferase [Pseudodesulfovibrio sp. S3]
MKHKLIDLFSGCGGMTLGFVHPDYCGRFESVFALDNDQAAVNSYIANFGSHAVCDDIENWASGGLVGQVPEADIVIGGPPCQGFSLLNKKRKGDHRRALWEPYMDIVAMSGARVFVIENVQGLLKADEKKEIVKRAEKLGFKTTSALLNAADYGAPQTRKRAFIVGWKMSAFDVVSFPPKPTHSLDPERTGLPRWRTVADMISDLPPPEGFEIRDVPAPLNLHFRRNPTAKSLQRYRAVPPGGNRFDLQRNAPEITPQCWIRKVSGGTDLFGRLWWDRPSVTIRTEFFKPEKGRYLHPEQHRPITHREAARLMGFPDHFVFTGTKTEVARQIGNAVPPDMAAAVARAIADVLAMRARKAA